MSATEYLKLRLADLVNAEAIEAVAECVIAYEDKSKKRELCLFLQDIFNIGKEKELEKIIDTYVSMLNNKSIAIKNPSHTKSPKQQHKSMKNAKAAQSPSTVSTPNSSTNVTVSKKPAVDAYIPFSPKASSGKRTPVVSQCGCMATAHPFHASCYECGYILCIKNRELPCCGYCKAVIVLPASVKNIEDNDLTLVVDDTNVFYFRNSGNNADMIRSYKQKDKLLQFDKENAKRTHVHDAQADYYESSTWLTAEEKREIDEKEKTRRAAKNRLLNTRKINISFDIAGRKMVEYSDGVEEEEEAATVKPETIEPVNEVYLSNAFAGSGNTLPNSLSSSDRAANEVSGSSGGGGGNAIYDDNRELEYSASRAGEVYRSMKKHWEEEDTAKLNALLGIKSDGGGTTSAAPRAKPGNASNEGKGRQKDTKPNDKPKKIKENTEKMVG